MKINLLQFRRDFLMPGLRQKENSNSWNHLYEGNMFRKPKKCFGRFIRFRLQTRVMTNVQPLTLFYPFSRKINEISINENGFVHFFIHHSSRCDLAAYVQAATEYTINEREGHARG